MPSVSVVVPIYNARDYLLACVDSLFAQTVGDLEIILVDDASSDGSGSLADQLGQDHANVHVLHQQRHCPSEARNVGMRACTGDYLSFIDAYDWVEPTMYELLLTSAIEDEADIVSSGHCSVRDNVTYSVRPHPLAGIVLRERRDILSMRRQLFGRLPEDSLSHPLALFVGASIYRRSFVEENALAFEEVAAADTLFSIAAYAHARCISFVCSTDYCYRMDNPARRVRACDWGSIRHYEKFVGELAALARDEVDAAECLRRVGHTAAICAILYVEAVASSDLNESERVSAVHSLAGSRTFQDHCVGFPQCGMTLGEQLFVRALEHDNVRAVLGLARLYRMLCRRGGHQSCQVT